METTAPVLQSTLKMHSHRCEACAAKGKEVVWIHPEADFAQVSAHRCPECGTINWKQSAMDNAKIPQPLPRNQSNKLDTVLGYSVLAVALILLAYLAYVYLQKSKNAALADLPVAGKP